jgi:hypothetical protein
MPVCLTGQHVADRVDLPIPSPLQVFLGLHVPADNGTGCARIIIREVSGLLLDVFFIFISEQTMSDGWCGR